MSASRIGAGLALVALAGCGAPPQLLQTELKITGPFKAGGQVMWVDATRGRVFALDPAASPPTVKSVPVARNAIYTTTTPAADRLLVLSGGKEALKVDQVAETPGLTVVDAAAGGPQATRFYPLEAAFDRIAVSPDGRFAVAYYSPNPDRSGAFFRNPNEMALLDLSAAPGDGNPTFRTIRSLGDSPTGVLFSPPLAIPAGAEPRSLAVVLTANALTLLDLSHRARPEITVPLTSLDAVQTVTPRQLVFAPGLATIFVRADGAADVFAITLDARTPADPSENDYHPRINQPSSGKVARDMIVYGEGPRTLLLTANQTEDLALIDPVSSQTAVIPVGAPVDSILAIPPDAPTEVVLFSRGSPQRFVSFLDLKNLSSNLERNLTRRNLARPVSDLVLVPGNAQLLVVHDDARTIVSVLDLGPHRTDTPIEGQLPLKSYDFASGGHYLVGVSSGLSRLGVLDLATMNPHDLKLDADPKKVLALDGRLVVDHQDPEGRVTVVPDPSSGREDARIVWGFFLAGVLDDPLKD